MNTDPVRLNITLPKKLVQSLDKLAGPRKRSRFIAKALENQIKQLEKAELEKLLAQGYQATEKESADFAREFEDTDLEGWDEY
jgi:metal-responsive CopG/Arc/MetJ family transcriptional regulator